MSSQTYYPLIGIDWDHNEKHREWPGANVEDAARKLGERFELAEVLSNHTGQKRGGNGSGMYNRKRLWKASAPPNGALKIPSMSPTLTDVLGHGADVLSLRLVKDVPKLIEMLRSLGFVFELKDVDGQNRLLMDRRVTCAIEKSELGQIHDLVRERRTSIIVALEAEAEPSKPQEPADPLKGKTIQEIMLTMLPQMPTPFTADDLIARLNRAGFTELASDRVRLISNIHYAMKKEEIRKTKTRGRYEVVEAYRHRRAATEPPQDPDPIIEAVPPADVQPDLPLESLQPPRIVIEVPPPEPEPQPDSGTAVLNGHQLLVSTLLDLASQAAAGGADVASLAVQANKALEQLQSDLLNSVDAFTSAFQPLIDQWNRQAATRQALVRSLSTVPSEAEVRS